MRTFPDVFEIDLKDGICIIKGDTLLIYDKFVPVNNKIKKINKRIIKKRLKHNLNKLSKYLIKNSDEIQKKISNQN